MARILSLDQPPNLCPFGIAASNKIASSYRQTCGTGARGEVRRMRAWPNRIPSGSSMPAGSDSTSTASRLSGDSRRNAKALPGQRCRRQVHLPWRTCGVAATAPNPLPDWWSGEPDGFPGSWRGYAASRRAGRAPEIPRHPCQRLHPEQLPPFALTCQAPMFELLPHLTRGAYVGKQI
jgi:hypothetical protein